MPLTLFTRMIRTHALFLLSALALTTLPALIPLVSAAGTCSCFTADAIVEVCLDSNAAGKSPVFHNRADPDAIDGSLVACSGKEIPAVVRRFQVNYFDGNEYVPEARWICGVIMGTGVGLEKVWYNSSPDYFKHVSDDPITPDSAADCSQHLNEAAKRLGIL